MKKFYDLKPLLEQGCHWMILFGMRSNGKSYGVKEHVLNKAYKKKEKFVYLRRWGDDIRAKEVGSYFDDMPISKITKGDYEGVAAYQGYFYFCNYDDEGKVIKSGEPIGRYCALNMAERYKSQVFKNTTSIVYEEFLTSKIYLGSAIVPEPKMLMQFVSTVARDKDIDVFMIGNTVSRVCPYISEWGLHNMLTMKPGSIDVYHLRGENGTVDIAVENCEVVATDSKMFFGLASKQITSGEWDVDEQPKLLKPYEYYDMLYELSAEFTDFKYCIQLMMDGETGGCFVYIYPNTGKRKIDRIVTNVFHTDPMITNGLNGKIKAECIIAECFRSGKVCFSDNLTGTDFRQVLAQYDFKGVIL